MSTLAQLAKAYATAHRLRDGAPWALGALSYCGSLMYRFNGHVTSYSTARLAYAASGIRSKTASAAPVGAYHFYSIPGTKAGHVAQDLTGGGRVLFMASNHLGTRWGSGIGTNSHAGYMKAARATYLGWSLYYGVNRSPKTDDASDWGKYPRKITRLTKAAKDRAMVRRIAAYLNEGAKPSQRSAASRNGIRGPRYWALVQRQGKRDGLYGRGYLVNGIPGPKSRAVEAHYAKVA